MIIKKTLSKSEIIKFAFSEWGKIRFKNMSLSLIANKIKITKAALYRHYRNKEALLKSMTDLLIGEMHEVAESFFNESQGLSPDEIIKLYINKNFTFFAKNIFYFYFYLVFVSRIKPNKNSELFLILHKTSSLFYDVLSNIKTWLKPNESDYFIKFIFSTGVFILMNKINEQFSNKEIKKSLEDKEINELINSINHIVLNGIFIKKQEEINFDEIEKKFYNKITSAEKNPILDAIATVVAKNGLWNASISKIANEMNINKSNLYFYFKNKNQMINEMVISELENINNIIKENASHYQKFEEKIYISILLTASYFLSDKRILHVFDWLHHQKIDMKNFKECVKKYNYLYYLIDSDVSNVYINKNLFNPYFIMGFINMQIIKEILLSELQNIDISKKNFRYVFKYFFNGIKEKE